MTDLASCPSTSNIKGMLRPILLLMASIVLVSAADAPDVAGDWLGALSVNGVNLRLALHLKPSDGKWTGSLDSLDQGANGIPIDQVAVSAGHLSFQVPVIQGSFEGKIDSSAAVIAGVWSQGGGSLPLEFRRSREPVTLKRPQEPKPPYPYETEDVAYDNSAAQGVRLAGTFTKPRGTGPFPAVLLITGSGPQNRNEELFGHKPFLVLADYLTRRGIAVLRVDDRGVGQSTGSSRSATTADLATDTIAGVRYLLARLDVDKKHVGLIGHSEGGIIAPIVASKMPELSFIVLLAGSGVSGDKVLEQQVYRLALAGGATPEQAAQSRESQRKVMAVLESGKSLADQESELMKLAGGNPAAEKSLKDQLPQLNSPWFRYFLTYDPASSLKNVKCPVLALNGGKDAQVDPEQNLPAIEAALKLGGNKDVTVKQLPGLNHLFQTATTGGVDEYGKIEETLSPAALKVIGDWIENHVKPASK